MDLISRLLALSLFSIIILPGCSKNDDPLIAFYSGDYDRSLQIWNSRAKNGDDSAQNYLGIHYHLGLGVDRDINQSFYWYDLASKSGNPDAQNNLGMLYVSGELGNPDFEQAYIWLFASYQQGNKNAHKGLQSISGQLSPNRVQLLKEESLKYVINDIIDPENDDF